MKEYKSFYKKVEGNEGDKCNYNTRLDTYGCGCQHDCSYCYAKSLLSFRGLWDAKEPSVADIGKIKRKVNKLQRGDIVRLGGMTDCFAPIENEHGVTYETIKALNDRGVRYLIVTKSDLVADDKYMDILDKELAHVQVTVTCFDDDKYKALNYEKAVLPSRRIAAIEKLQRGGIDVQMRVSPYIPQYVDLEKLNAVKCDKVVVEFLRVNTWVKKWLDLDYTEYTIKQSGYLHMPLERKRAYIEKIRNKRVTVCEDETEAYEFWKNNFNPNKNDCCDLRE